MFRGLKEILFGRAVQRDEEWFHERLGVFRFDKDLDGWRSQITAEGAPLGFLICGNQEPDPVLVQHAIDIVEGEAAFRARVAAFLRDEAIRQPLWAAEISELEIQDVNLFWPERPDDGMIYFTGPDEYRVWRCDYVNRVPQDLGFDS